MKRNPAIAIFLFVSYDNPAVAAALIIDRPHFSPRIFVRLTSKRGGELLIMQCFSVQFRRFRPTVPTTRFLLIWQQEKEVYVRQPLLVEIGHQSHSITVSID